MGPRTTARPAVATDALVTVADGLRLATRRWAPAAPDGAGTPFLLVHGLASNARTWDGVGPLVAAAGHEAVAVDLRGHGRSAKPDAGYDVATVADDLADLIGAIGLERPVAVGQSWGGNVVVELGARRPELLRGVAAVDGGLIELERRFPTWDACVAELTPPRLAGTPLGELEGRLRGWHPHWPETGIAGTLANFEVRPDGTVAPWLTLERHLAILRGLWEHRPTELLRGYPLPLLLLPAERDDAWAPERRAGLERAAALAPRFRVRTFPGADHDIHAERPAELAEALLGALADGFLG